MFARNRTIFTALSLLVLAVVSACGTVQPTKQPAARAPTPAPAATPTPAPGKQKLMTLGAVASTSNNYLLSVAIAKAINTEFPAVKVNVIETGGGTDNLKRLAQNQVEVGLVGLTGADDALFGKGPFKDNAIKDTRILWSISVQAFHFVVLADSNIKTLKDLESKGFNPSATGTSTEKDVEATLSALGIKPQYYRSGVDDAVQAFRDRRIDGFVKGGQVPESTVTEIAVSMPIRLLGLSETDRATVEKANPVLPFVTIPAGKYKGVDSPVTVPAIVTSYATRAGLLTEEQAYQMIKAVYNQREEVQKAFPGADIDFPKLTASSGRVPLHAGVVRFLKQDLKIDVPERLIPPEYKG